jgi:predicted Zn finger-like uncharacterized protein
MLFTRCPACNTTFRVTDEALTKAGGQVRCGRCANVFNANAELRETVSPQGAAPAPLPATPAPSAAEVEEPPARVTAGDQPLDALSVAAVIAQVKLVGDESQAQHAETQRSESVARQEAAALSVEQVQQVLEDPAASATTAIWALENPVQAPRASGWWRFGTLLAVIALAVQGIHHFRESLAGQSLIGPWVQQAYGMFGTPLAPRWDIEQYQILDWIATAEPNTRGQGRLQITARIHNRGPQPQPYPHIHLQLKDRWEDTVGSRIFDPSEYLQAGAAATQMMPPGNTVQAQLDVVDPGPDAYGFELDVCVEVETDVVTCGNDEVFL